MQAIFRERLTYHDTSSYCSGMSSIKISSKIEKPAWDALKALAEESHQSISGLLTEAVQDYVSKRRIRPDVLRHLEDSIKRNEELGKRLAE